MRNGKKICEHLKVVRKQIADANDIPYEITECTHQGPCAGTCPKCESELRYIENQLSLRRAAGKVVSIVGLSLGISTAFMATGCTPRTKSSESVETLTQKEDIYELDGDVVLTVHSNDTTDLQESAFSEGEIAPEDAIYSIADEMTEFPGGDIALMNYIKQNLRYPALAGEMGIQGRVILSFIVERDGAISNIVVLRTPAEELSKEAIRVIQSMPKWKPGKIKGTPVRMKYVLPVTFRIE